ncbi:unnamed protein product [Merluccius merluccius]
MRWTRRRVSCHSQRPVIKKHKPHDTVTPCCPAGTWTTLPRRDEETKRRRDVPWLANAACSLPSRQTSAEKKKKTTALFNAVEEEHLSQKMNTGDAHTETGQEDGAGEEEHLSQKVRDVEVAPLKKTVQTGSRQKLTPGRRGDAGVGFDGRKWISGLHGNAPAEKNHNNVTEIPAGRRGHSPGRISHVV